MQRVELQPPKVCLWSDKFVFYTPRARKSFWVSQARINDSANFAARRLARPLVRAAECDLDSVTRVRRTRE